MKMSSRNPYSFPDFSLRRLLLQGARAARGSPPLGTRLCGDVERGTVKHDKSHAAGTSSNSKVRYYHKNYLLTFTLSLNLSILLGAY